MISFLLAPFLMLLSVFGLYLAPSPHTQPSPSAITRPEIATTTDNSVALRASTTPASVPAVVVVEKKIEAKQPAPLAPAASSPSRTEEPTPTANFTLDSEVAIMALMNKERATEGLPPLTLDATLTSLSRSHSADMITQGYFSHNDPDGCGSSCRADDVGYNWRAIGENIYMSSGYELTAAKEADMVVSGWMKSPGHRANILGSQYSHVGVGVVQKGESVYVTATYAKPR